MRKLILLFISISFIRCGDKIGDEQINIPEELNFFDTEKAIKEAVKYKIDISEIDINACKPMKQNEDSVIVFTGRVDEKLWIGVYDCYSKAQINNSISNERYNLEVTKPNCIGALPRKIKYFYVVDFISESNNYVYQLHNRIDDDKSITTGSIIFSNENKVDNKKIINSEYANPNIKKWGDNTILSYSKIEYSNGETKSIIAAVCCYSIEGEFKFISQSVNLEKIMKCLPTHDMYEGIYVNGLDVSLLNILTEETMWTTKIDLKIPANAKVETPVSEVIDDTTLKIVYNVTLYDGTKLSKTVNVDIFSGSYTIL